MLRVAEVVHRSDASRWVLVALLLAGGAANACTTNHDALAEKPKAGGTAGVSGGGFGGFGGFGNTGNQAQGGRPNPDVEVQGDNVLTIVNGVVDAPSVRLCFARVGDDGAMGELVGEPSAELGYAATTVLTQLDGFSLVDDVIQPWVIAGELERVDGLSCSDAVALAQNEEAKVTPVADPEASAGSAGTPNAAGAAAPEPELQFPSLRARPLAALPAGTVNIGRSILMVLTGCLGGAAYTDYVETSVCGAAYTPRSPTLQPVIVKLSRAIGFDKVALQGVHASQPTESLDLRASGDSGAISFVFASDVRYGSIEPRPANTQYGLFDLGVDKFNFGLQAIGERGAVRYQATWSDILQASRLDAIVAGRPYTAIFLGPNATLRKDGWWNKCAFSVVDNDPTRL